MAKSKNGNRYGVRKAAFRKLYIPKAADKDVIEYLTVKAKSGENVTQLITEAVRLYMQKQ